MLGATSSAAKTTQDLTKQTEAVRDDCPCWGSPNQCSLLDLLRLLPKEKAILYDSLHYLVLNKPPDLRMDGPYQATVHKLLTYWYPPPSINKLCAGDDHKDAIDTTGNSSRRHYTLLLDSISHLHQHNALVDNELRPCHQLDYATSGILLVAKSQAAASHVARMLEERKVTKSYLAIVVGHVHIGPNNNNDSRKNNCENWLRDIPVWQGGNLNHNDDVSFKNGRSEAETILRQHLHGMEEQYRKCRSRLGKFKSNMQQPQQQQQNHRNDRDSNDTKSSKKNKTTFSGYQPVHSIFQKWKAKMAKEATEKDTAAVLATSDDDTKRSTKRRRKQHSTFLSERDWRRIWEPVDQVVAAMGNEGTDHENWHQSLVWNTLGAAPHGQLLKQAIWEATDVHNDLLRSAIEQHHNNEDNGKSNTLPTLFRLRPDDTNTNMNGLGTFYVFCPLADDPEKFSMGIPTTIAKDFPHMAHLTIPTSKTEMENDSNCDVFKPSLTKCTIVQHGSWAVVDEQNNKLELPITKVKLFPITGRRHQLRVHLALAGHPILGDITYCGTALDVNEDPAASSNVILNPLNTSATSHRFASARCARMCLHAHSLTLPSLLGEPDPHWTVQSPDPFPINRDGMLHLDNVGCL